MKASVHIERSTHENVYVTCPKCRRPLTFNRVSDLEPDRPIAGRDVTCLHPDCRAEFWIGMDVINPPYDLLVTEGIQLMREKRYGACVAKLATALESMLGLYLRVELIYRPAAKSFVSTDDLNSALNELRRKTGRLGYVRLRNIAIRHAFRLGAVPKFTSVVENIRKLDTRVGCPKDDELHAVKPRELSEFLLLLKSIEVYKVRNKVVHQTSHRPPRHEAEEALEQVRELMARADEVLGILPGDDPDAYRNHDQGHLGRGSVGA